MSNLVIRPLEAGEEHLFLSMNDPGLAGFAAFGRSFSETFAAGEYRPEWTWVALRDGNVVARAAWWGAADDTEPVSLDWLDCADPAEGAELIRTAAPRAAYHLPVPGGWRDQPDVTAAVEVRRRAVLAAGMTPFVERVQYAWTPAAGLPPRPGRLVFRPEPDDEVIVDVLRRVLVSTIDAHQVRAIGKLGLDGAAREELDGLNWFVGPRDWWRLAYTPDGELVGITTPTWNTRSAVIGYVGVVPEQRGHGYGYDLLVEGTHMHAEKGVERIVEQTDLTNGGMIAAFVKAGYVVDHERMIFE